MPRIRCLERHEWHTALHVRAVLIPALVERRGLGPLEQRYVTVILKRGT